MNQANNSTIPYEIERKYLIQYPDVQVLMSRPDCIHKSMMQMYLISHVPGESRRIRKVMQEGVTTYFYTQKEKVTDLRRVEQEREITAEEFEQYAAATDTNLFPIIKDRYCIRENDVCYEVDVFPFWDRQAFLEIELESEEQEIVFPDYLSIVREITHEPEYTNHSLAARIPLQEV